MRFRGRKGVATAAGAFLALVRPLASWSPRCRWDWSSARGPSSPGAQSRAARASGDGIGGEAHGRAGDPWVTAFAVLAGAFIVWAHRSNIGRLLRGEEKRINDDRRARRGGDG